MKQQTIWILILISLSWTVNLFGQKRKLVINNGHSSSVSSVSFSEDGRYLASGSSDNTVKVWEVSTGRLLRTLKGHSGSVSSVSFSEDGRYLASGSRDQTVKVWEVSTGYLLRTLEGHSDYVENVSFSGDSRYLASGSRDGTIKVWEVSAGYLLRTLEGHSNPVESVSFSEDSRYLASGSWDKTVKIWRFSTGDLLHTLQGHSNSVERVVFSGDGRYLASGSSDKTVKIWEVSTWNLLRTLEGYSSSVESVIFSDDSHYLASVSMNGILKFWEVSTGHLLGMHTFGGHDNYRNPVALSLDGRYLASGSSKVVKIWETSTEILLHTLEGQSGLYCMSFSESSCHLASRGEDNTIKILEIFNGNLWRTLAGHNSFVKDARFSLNDRYLASASSDKTVRVWKVRTGLLWRTFKVNNSSIESLSFSDDGRYLALGSSDKTVNVWEISTGHLLYTLEGHSNSVYSVIFSEDGRYLASGSLDQTVNVWEVSTGRLLCTLEGHSSSVLSVSFSEDGRYLASGSSDKMVKVWEVSTGRLLRTFEGHSSSVYSVIFSEDGQYLASGSSDKTVKVWEVSTGRLLHTLEGHNKSVFSMIFSENGRYLVSIGRDNTVRFWEVSTGKSLLTAGVFDEGKAYIVTTPDGRYDGNKSGLEYLHYVEGIKIKPLPKNNPYHIKGLMAKVLNPIQTEIQTIIQTIAKVELAFINPTQNIVVNTPNYQIKAFVANIGENSLSLFQNQKAIRYRLEGKFLIANVQLLEGENVFSLQTTQNGEFISTSIAITYQKPKPIPYFRKGKDHALFFAVKDYEHWGDLGNPIRDAEAIAAILQNDYGFDTRIIENPHKNEIRDELIKYLKFRDYEEDEQLLIYLSGHGEVDAADQGYFIPKNAPKDDLDRYYSYENIKGLIRRSKCKHILLIIDACYSCFASDEFPPLKGRSPDFKKHHPNSKNSLQEIIKRKLGIESAIMINSGWERTSDGIEHSPMTVELLDILGNPQIYEGVIGVRADIQVRMEKKAEQKKKKPPCFNGISPKQKDEGEFLFISIEKQ